MIYQETPEDQILSAKIDKWDSFILRKGEILIFPAGISLKRFELQAHLWNFAKVENK